MGAVDAEKIDLQVQIANMYYRDELSQQEIANKVSLSRPTVSRILKSCIDDGIVTINIKDVSSRQYEMAKGIKKKYNLQYVSVVSSNRDRADTLSAIGQATADYLEEYVDRDMRIGISSGVTISNIIPYLYPILNHSLDIYQIQGDANHQIDTSSSFVTTEIAKALHATPHALHIPLLVNSKVLRDLLIEEPVNKMHFQELENLDLAIVGLGIVENLLPSTSDNWFTFAQDKQELQALYSVGDICGNSLDCKGNLSKADISNRTITMTLEQLRTCKNCLAVVCGKEKAEILQATIVGKLISSVIMDEELAATLL